jgi:hypothetical protein
MEKMFKFLGCEMKFRISGEKKKEHRKELYDLGDILIKGASVFSIDAGLNTELKAKLPEFVNDSGVYRGGNILVKNYILSDFDITQSKCAHTIKGNAHFIKPNVISFIIGNNNMARQITVCADCLYDSLGVALDKG